MNERERKRKKESKTIKGKKVIGSKKGEDRDRKREISIYGS